MEKMFIIPPEYSGKRADVVLTEVLKNFSRSQIRKFIKGDYILINEVPLKPSKILSGGEEVAVNIPAPTPLDLIPEQYPLNVIYEDDDLIVINKDPGLVVHPGAGVRSGTLVNFLLYKCRDLSGIGGKVRPGIVHRLDKNTSGVIVVAKNDYSHSSLVDQFKNQLVEKEYLAIVHGRIKENSGTISTNIGRHHTNRIKMSSKSDSGRKASTSYEVLKRFEEHTYLKVIPKTGRTHQIRVHLSDMGYPIVCDDLYGIKNSAKKDIMFQNIIGRQALHSSKLGFVHPRDNKSIEFIAELTEDMKTFIEYLDKGE